MRLHHIGLIALALTFSCKGTPPPADDAGDAQWVMEAIPTLLGRPAKSSYEIEALTHIAASFGRDAVAADLMARPEFDRYWAMVFLEDMQLDGSGVHAIDRDCLVDAGAPPFYESVYDTPFFDGMEDTEATTALSYLAPGAARLNTPGVNNPLSKLVEAAVHNDRLDLAFAAHMPVLASTHRGDNKTNVRIRFADRVMNKDLSCLSCHNGEWSATDDALAQNRANDGWDRTWPMYEMVIEGGLFDYPDGGGGQHSGVYGGTAVATNMNNLFGIEQWTGSDTVFGLKPECVTRRLENGTQVGLNVSAFPNDAAALGGLNGNQGVLDLTNHFLGMSQSLGSVTVFPITTSARPAPSLPPMQTPTITPPTCTGCHDVDGALDPGFADIPDARIIEVLTSDWPVAMTYANCAGDTVCATEAVRTLRQSVPYKAKQQYNSQQEAFAITIAQQVVDHVVEEVSGGRLTLAHGLPRNVDASELQRNLTYTLVNNGWSLRALLAHMVLDEGFNRHAPVDTAMTDHYVLPQIAKPYKQLQPNSSALPQDNYASLGDSVHRHSVAHLSEKVHHALGWPSAWTPGQDGTAPVFPEPSFLQDLGRFESGDRPGWDGAILPGQLTWEARMGHCEKPAVAVRSPQMQMAPGHETDLFAYGDLAGNDRWEDWIDVLVDESIASNWTLAQALSVTKERLLQDPSIGISEQTAIESVSAPVGLFSVSDLTGSVAPADLEYVMREYCGALVTSPQFMMGGVSNANADTTILEGRTLPARPVFQRPGPLRLGDDTLEPTTYTGWCVAYGYMLNLSGECKMKIAETVPMDPVRG